jgi:DNA-binding NarL/FixJ family response regulator
VGGRLQILVADRNVLVIEALEDLFVELGGGTVVITARSLLETLAIAQRAQPDLIVLDAWMGTDADSAVRQVLECSPRSTVIVMATNCDEEFERRMRRAGAAGSFEKERVPAVALSILDSVRARR